jgi:cell division protein FtsI/penicillin-binding protein 2
MRCVKGFVNLSWTLILLVLLFAAQPIARQPQSLAYNSHGGTRPVASACASAMAQRAVCLAANQRAVEIMNARQLEAFMVVQEVRTGVLVAFAASQPSKLDVTTAVLPLSVFKLLLAASWWDNHQPDSRFDSYRKGDTRTPTQRMVSTHEMLVGGSDNAGKQMALALRRSVGTQTVLNDFKRYGFGSGTDSAPDDSFWEELAPAFQSRLAPVRGYSSLSEATTDSAWADTLSLGETNVMVTGLHVSRFLQAVGNGGVMLQPVAREQEPNAVGLKKSRQENLRSPIRVMQRHTARLLQAAMRDVVQRGTAKSIANALGASGWQMGGKTGTGPGPAPIGPQSDGWFAGLIFDSQGRARFTVATFVRHGGTGGGNAAKISSELARYLIDNGVGGEKEEKR